MAYNTQVPADNIIDIFAGRALISTGGGGLSVASTTATELDYVNGVTSGIQTQLDDRAERIVSRISNIDGGTVGNTALFLATSNFIPTKLYVECTFYDTVVVGAFAASVGTNGATYNNIITALAITGLTAVNTYQYNAILAPTRTTYLDNNDMLYLRIAAGITSGTLTLRTKLFGFYV